MSISKSTPFGHLTFLNTGTHASEGARNKDTAGGGAEMDFTNYIVEGTGNKLGPNAHYYGKERCLCCEIEDNNSQVC